MSERASGHVVVLGGGAVGSYVGGMLAASGIAVVLIDGWPAHVEAIRERGLTVAAPEGEQRPRIEAWHLGEAHRLRSLDPAAALLAVKLYDTAWAARLFAAWLPAAVPVVTLQNGLVEDVVARAVGWGRVLGGIAGGLDVSLRAPGIVQRSRRRWSSSRPVFKIGEVHGRKTARAERLAALLDRVDRAAVTSDLWGERWQKLCANTMTTGLSGLTGLDLHDVYAREDTRRIAIRLGVEALAVGEAMGFDVPALFGVAREQWRAAADASSTAREQIMTALAAQASNMVAGGASGTLQDLLKKRPTEVEFLNGYVAAKALQHGVAAPTHEVIATLIRCAERGERAIDIQALGAIETFAPVHAQ